MAGHTCEKKADPNISPYLRQSLRTLKEAEQGREDLRLPHESIPAPVRRKERKSSPETAARAARKIDRSPEYSGLHCTLKGAQFIDASITLKLRDRMTI